MAAVSYTGGPREVKAEVKAAPVRADPE